VHGNKGTESVSEKASEAKWYVWVPSAWQVFWERTGCHVHPFGCPCGFWGDPV